MKKSLLIALLLIPFLGFSQTTKPIDGFLGIKFGTSKADVIAAVNAKGGKSIGEKNDILFFTGLSLGHRPIESFQVGFFNNQAYVGALVFKPENDPATFNFYNSLLQDITDIYGKGKSVRLFKSPYVDGDGYETTAVSSGNANILTDWKSDTNSMQLHIDNELNVVLIYTDTKVAAQAKVKQKEKEKSDF